MSQEALLVAVFVCGFSLGFAVLGFMQGRLSTEQAVKLILNEQFAKMSDEFYARQTQQGKDHVELVKHLGSLLHSSFPTGSTALINEFLKQVDGKPNEAELGKVMGDKVIMRQETLTKDTKVTVEA